MSRKNEDNESKDYWNENNKWKDDFEDKYNSEVLIDPYENNNNNNDNNNNFEQQYNNKEGEEGGEGGYDDKYILNDEIKSKRIPLTHPKKIEDYPDNVLIAAKASTIAVRAGMQGFTLGSFLGLFQGFFAGMQSRGIPGAPSPVSIALAQGFSSGVTFGLWLSVYEAVTYTTGAIRRKSDVFNPVLGGFLAGAIVTSRTRNKYTILGSAVSSALMMGLLDIFTRPERDISVLPPNEIRQAVNKELNRPQTK